MIKANFGYINVYVYVISEEKKLVDNSRSDEEERVLSLCMLRIRRHVYNPRVSTSVTTASKRALRTRIDKNAIGILSYMFISVLDAAKQMA